MNQVTVESEAQYCSWGEIFYKEGKQELALESLRNAIIHNPKRVSSWGMMIDCLEELGRKGSLRSTIRQATEHTGDRVFKKRLIELLVEENEYDEALDIYEELLEVYPEDKDLWLSYYKILFFDEPTQGNCRAVLSIMVNLNYLEGMDELIRIAKNENDGENWPDSLAQEFGLKVE